MVRNALLDSGSPKTCINKVVAKELRLHREDQKVNVEY